MGPLPPLQWVASGRVLPTPHWLSFRNPDKFIAGEVHNHVPYWEHILQHHTQRAEIGSYITKGVDIQLFWRHFTGTFNKKYYDSPLPPPSIFPNNSSCRGFEAFITNTILERVTNGSLQVIGQVDQVDPPHLVLPLTIEPSKPRLCHVFLICGLGIYLLNLTH